MRTTDKDRERYARRTRTRHTFSSVGAYEMDNMYQIIARDLCRPDDGVRRTVFVLRTSDETFGETCSAPAKTRTLRHSVVPRFDGRGAVGSEGFKGSAAARRQPGSVSRPLPGWSMSSVRARVGST